MVIAAIVLCVLSKPALSQEGAAPGVGGAAPQGGFPPTPMGAVGPQTPGVSLGPAARSTISPQTTAPPQIGLPTLGTQNAGNEQQRAGKADAGQPGEKGTQNPLPTANQMNDFQAFVSQSLGWPLPMFGMELFANQPTTFAPVDRVPVPSDYVIGPGDELQIRLWGQLDGNVDVPVDRAGSVFVPKVGQVRVAGVHYADLREMLTRALSRVYRNFDLDVQMGQLRSIQILVLGNVSRPGMYTISSLSTMVNALFASGGPSVNGSMRHVQLKRRDTVVTELDLYDLLIKGDKSKDSKLLPGDVLYVPPVGSLVAVSAGVRTPAIYELRGETTFADLVKMAGGFTTTAYRKEAKLERLSARSAREVQTVALNEAGMTTPLRDGDVVQITAISPRFENAVTLRGNVARAGRYPWHSGMRIKDLLPSREYLIAPEHWNRVNAATGRQTAGDIRSDVVAQSVDVNWDYALVERIEPNTLTTQLVPFNLGNAVIREDAKDNLELQPGDIVTIFSERDIQLPSDKRSKFVALAGEFNVPGVYKVAQGETLRELITRAGGYAQHAYVRGAVFTREAVRRSQQTALDKFINDLELDLQRSAAAETATAATTGDAMLTRQRLDAQRRVIVVLRQTGATGRLVLDLKDFAADPNLLPDIKLEDGDAFFVPAQPDNVSVMGLVYNGGDFVYQPNARVRQYLRRAGGPTRYADKGHMYILRANGSVSSSTSSRSRFADAVLHPGDTVIVPEQFETGSFLRNLKDWGQIIANFGLGAAAIHLLTTK